MNSTKGKQYLYLGLTKEGKQVGLFLTSEQAFVKNDVNEAQMWQLNKKTGQYHPTNASVSRLEILPKKEDSQ